MARAGRRRQERRATIARTANSSINVKAVWEFWWKRFVFILRVKDTSLIFNNS